MKAINFSVVDVLPSLLDKSKVQTIRPAWNNYTLTSIGFEPGVDPDLIEVVTRPKPSRFKVGDEVKIFWKQRSEYKFFCQDCGTGLSDMNVSHHILGNCRDIPLFNKLLGTVEVTEVFKVDLTSEMFWPHDKEISNAEEAAKLEGFSSAKQMFETIDKLYDLSQPKAFWVYRWKWL